MKFIPIMEISSQIMTLIEEAEKEIIIVSPYVDIKNWDKLKRCLNNAIERKVAITFYARENAQQDLEPLRQLNVKLVLIKDLHAKIYLNETYGIVSSQNLYQYSDINSIDFAYSTETEEERYQLVKLINKYLSKTKTVEQIFPEKIVVAKIAEVKKVEETKVKVEHKIFLKEKQLDKIHRLFEDEFPKVKINSTATYVFCNRLLPFGDVMFREGFEIRFKHNIKDYTEIINILESLNFKNNHYQYKKELKMDNGHPSSMLFIPHEVDNINNLIDDYLFMTNKILDKTEKAVEKYMI
jgi:hypothetical protein